MKLNITKGTTSKLIELFIQDNSVTTGAGLTGLVFNSGSLTAYYIRNGGSAAAAISLVTMTLGTWVSGGFKEIDSTNMPGWYQMGLPDALLASGADSVVLMLKGATNMAAAPIEIQLTGMNFQDAVRAGLTALPNVAAGANGGLPTGNASGQVVMSGTAVGAIVANSFAAGAIDAAAIATDAIGSAEISAAAVTKIQAGLSTYAGADTAGTTTLLSRIPGTVQPQTGDAYARLGANGAGLTALGDTRLANLDATISSRSTLTAANVWQYVIEGTLTAERVMRIILAAVSGILSGAASTTIKIRDLLNTKDRITATVDADGNRSAVTLDGS